MVHKLVGGASGIFNDIAVFVGSALYTALNLEVSLQWSAHLQKPAGISLFNREKVYGLFLDGLANSLMDGIHHPCNSACRDSLSMGRGCMPDS